MSCVIKNFKHRGLKRLFERNLASGVNAQHVVRLKTILGLMNVTSKPLDMDTPGYHLHELKGVRRGTWSIRVSGNWRVTFRFEDGDAFDIDYEDYH